VRSGWKRLQNRHIDYLVRRRWTRPFVTIGRRDEQERGGHLPHDRHRPRPLDTSAAAEQLDSQPVLLYGDQKGPDPCSKTALDVELRGFEPLTPSMRTLGAEVVRGRWGRSAVAGSLSKPFAVGHVAVLVCCTAFGPSPRRVGYS
jgi:hypothetical protein